MEMNARYLTLTNLYQRHSKIVLLLKDHLPSILSLNLISVILKTISRSLDYPSQHLFLCVCFPLRWQMSGEKK